MDLSWLPADAGLPLVVVAVLTAYLLAIRGLARLVEDRSDPLYDWREAERRAERLLAEMLSATEVRTLQQRGYLEVASAKYADRVYRIPRFQGPIAVYEGGVLTNLLCVRSVDPIPNADAVLLHKLMIEGDEDAYLRAANSIRPRAYTFTA